MLAEAEQGQSINVTFLHEIRLGKERVEDTGSPKPHHLLMSLVVKDVARHGGRWRPLEVGSKCTQNGQNSMVSTPRHMLETAQC